MFLKGIPYSFCFFFSISGTEYTYTAAIHLIETQPFVAIQIFVGIESFHQFEFPPV